MTDFRMNVLQVDASYEDLMGRPRDVLIGSNVLDLTHPEDRATNTALLDRVRSGGAPFVITKRYLRPDGLPLWVTNQVSLLTDNGIPRLLAKCQQAEAAFSPVCNVLESWRLAKNMLSTLMNVQLLDPLLLHSPAVPLLLVLYIAESEGRVPTLRSLGDELRMTSAPLQRWIAVVRGFNLIELVGPDANPRASVMLTAGGMAKVETLLAAAWSSEASS